MSDRATRDDREETENYFPRENPLCTRPASYGARINLGRPNDTPRWIYRLINLDVEIDYWKGILYSESALASCTPVFIRSGQFGGTVQLMYPLSLFPSLHFLRFSAKHTHSISAKYFCSPISRTSQLCREIIKIGIHIFIAFAGFSTWYRIMVSLGEYF